MVVNNYIFGLGVILGLLIIMFLTIDEEEEEDES